MKFKNYLWLICVAMFVGLSLTLTACGDDDEENGIDLSLDPDSDSGSSSNQSAITQKGGMLLTKIIEGAEEYDWNQQTTFNYDEELRLVSAYHDDKCDLYINYEEGTIDWEDDSYSLSFNKKGYISKITGSWDDNEEGYYSKGSATLNYEYDNDGHLIKESFVGEETWKDGDDAEVEHAKGNGTSIYTWQDGNLVSINTTDEWKEDNGYTDIYHIEISNEYDNTENRYLQIFADLGYIDNDALFVGLFGNGSKNLPTSSLRKNKSYEGDDTYESFRNHKYDFTLNTDGTIKSYTDYIEDNNGYNYTDNYSFYYIAAKDYVAQKNVSPLTRSPKDTKKAMAKKIRNIIKNRIARSNRVK